MEINPLTTIIRDRNNTKKYFIYTFYSEQTKKWETVAVKKVNYESIKEVKWNNRIPAKKLFATI